MKTVANKSLNKVYIIQSVDKKIPLDEIADAKNMELEQVYDELEAIVGAGTKINIDYYIRMIIDEDKAEMGYNIYQTANNCYAYPSEEYERCIAKFIREDTNQDPPVAYFSLIALAGYFYNESNGHFEKLPSDIRGFELYNKENYMFKWYTDDYSN